MTKATEKPDYSQAFSTWLDRIGKARAPNQRPTVEAEAAVAVWHRTEAAAIICKAHMDNPSPEAIAIVAAAIGDDIARRLSAPPDAS